MLYTFDQIARALKPSSSRNDFIKRLMEASGEKTPCPISAGEKQEDVNPMHIEKRSYHDAVAVAQIAAEPSDLTKARKRLKDRLLDIDGQKDVDLRKQFSMDLQLPKTREELFAGLADGTYKLTLLPGKEDRPVYDYEPLRSIVIDNPKKDEANYDLASKARRTAREDALDIILTQDEKAGLEALNSFKAFTFSA